MIQLTRKKITIIGQVQGVGYRPFVYRVAHNYAITGTVANTSQGLFIEAQGEEREVAAFVHDLQTQKPPLARVLSCVVEDLPIRDDKADEEGFRIILSEESAHTPHSVLISSDVATCDDCLRDMFDPQNPRYLYPFTNCTNCGPRYTITRAIPYDRAQTSMACFPFCSECEREYTDPADRRFHAQPNACPKCGPFVWLMKKANERAGGVTDEMSGSTPAISKQEFSEGLRRYETELAAHAENHSPNTPQKAFAYSVQNTDGAKTSTEENFAEYARYGAAMEGLAEALWGGKIAAVKGLGGFHLVCDACNHEAVATLRARKKRPAKPLAVMCATLEDARRLADIDDAEAAQMYSIERPIVLARVKTDTPLSPLISPDTDYIGLMLPYTPLHHVLFYVYKKLLQEKFAQDANATAPIGALAPALVPALVMTSGNSSGEPICLGNREALRRLHNIADVFLLHNRDILIRTDDSVMRCHPNTGEPQFFRRARGYTPRPIFLCENEAANNASNKAQNINVQNANAHSVTISADNAPNAKPLCTTPKAEHKSSVPCVLGVGAELKSTLCLTRGNQAFVSQHIGDMQNLETSNFFREIATHLESVLEMRPAAIIRDLHPNYLSTQYATERALHDNVPLLTLQHHYAHIHSVLAENRYAGAALGLALDGTGYGEDGTLWGGEALAVNTQTLAHERAGHFSYLPLAGGETAIREPWRIAQGALHLLGITTPPPHKAWAWLTPADGEPDCARASAFLPQLLQRNVNCPRSSSCGRLFDAVAAMLGVCRTVQYEGQAAIQLEHIQDMSEQGAYPCPVVEDKADLSTPLELNTLALFAAAYADWCADMPASIISRRFHKGLTQGLAHWAELLAPRYNTKTIGLSGGVMQNRTLSHELPLLLQAKGFTVLEHQELPPNDACISLGQAAWGREYLKRKGKK